MRASRLVSVLLLLQNRGRMTARQLADELDVSVRTVYRDMESLGAAGVPLYGEPGHDGGYRLLDGYRTRLTGLTAAEAEALFLTGLPGPAADLGLGTVLATAQLKLMAALPEELRDRATRLQQRFHLDTSGWYTDPDPATHLAAIVAAVWTQRRVRTVYHRWKEPREVTRTLEPYGVVFKSGRWYTVAGVGSAVRIYRVSEIVELETLDERFDRPAGFDLTEHWKSTVDELDRRRYRGEATVLLSERLLAELPDWAEPTVVRAARRTARRVDDRFEVVIPIESTTHATGVLLRLGTEAEVLSPNELRAAIAENVRVLAERYAPRDT